MNEVSKSLFVKKILFTLSFLFFNTYSQTIFDDQVPFVFYQSQIYLKNYLDSTVSQVQKVDYSSKNFKNIPEVIVGIGLYNNNWNLDRQILFELTASNISQNSCDIELISDNNISQLYSIQASALIIDISQYPFVKIIKENKSFLFDSNYQYQDKKQYSSSLSGKKNATLVINGWKSPKNSANKFTLTAFITYIDDQNYQINISTSQSSLPIEEVTYTIIEYVIDPPCMYGIISNYDQQYQSPTSKECFFNMNCINSVRFFPVNFKVLNLQNYQQIQENYNNFFVCLNQFDFNTSSQTDPRLSLKNFTFNTNTIIYNYYIWDSTICYGSTSSSLFFYRKYCPKDQYFLEDKQICQSQIPYGYYCTQIDLGFQFFQCQNCGIQNCQNCQYANNQQNCTKCEDTFYLYQNQCSQNQPLHTFCDENLNCFNCDNLECQTCSNSQSSQKLCLTCLSSQILYNGICYNQNNPPDNTYCDWNAIQKCQKCQDDSCRTCSNPQTSLQCLTCQVQQILYEGKCYNKDNPPNNTYCDWNNSLKCYKCQDTNCLTCSDPQISPEQCLTCLAQQILYEGKCYNNSNPPENTHCDYQNLKCYKCQDANCLTCSDPQITPQQCLSCLAQQILYEGKCYNKNNPPENTYCDWSNNLKCYKCKDKDCQSCSDPNQQEYHCLKCYKDYILYLGKCYCQNKSFGVDCKEQCIPSCILCQDNNTCDQYSEERVYQDKQCHFSCLKCLIPQKNYSVFQKLVNYKKQRNLALVKLDTVKQAQQTAQMKILKNLIKRFQMQIIKQFTFYL